MLPLGGARSTGIDQRITCSGCEATRGEGGVLRVLRVGFPGGLRRRRDEYRDRPEQRRRAQANARLIVRAGGSRHHRLTAGSGIGSRHTAAFVGIEMMSTKRSRLGARPRVGARRERSLARLSTRGYNVRMPPNRKTESRLTRGRAKRVLKVGELATSVGSAYVWDALREPVPLQGPAPAGAARYAHPQCRAHRRELEGAEGRLHEARADAVHARRHPAGAGARGVVGGAVAGAADGLRRDPRPGEARARPARRSSSSASSTRRRSPPRRSARCIARC